jgi:hypothetical protein
VRMCANKVGAGVRCGACLLKIRLVNTRQFAPAHQIGQLKGLAFARTWGFESPLPHQTQKARFYRAFCLYGYRLATLATPLQHELEGVNPRLWRSSAPRPAISRAASVGPIRYHRIRCHDASARRSVHRDTSSGDSILLVFVSSPPALTATFTASSIGSLKGTSIRSNPFS